MKNTSWSLIFPTAEARENISFEGSFPGDDIMRIGSVEIVSKYRSFSLSVGGRMYLRPKKNKTKFYIEF